MTNDMKRYCLRLAMMMVIVATFAGCASSESTVESAVYTPEPLPEVLGSLPRRAKVLCLGDSPPDKGTVVLWSLPGRSLPDSDSGVSGFRGDDIAAVGHCEPIQITDFYWDPYGADYWVKIEYNDIEHNPIIGWVRLELITVE